MNFVPGAFLLKTCEKFGLVQKSICQGNIFSWSFN